MELVKDFWALSEVHKKQKILKWRHKRVNKKRKWRMGFSHRTMDRWEVSSTIKCSVTKQKSKDHDHLKHSFKSPQWGVCSNSVRPILRRSCSSQSAAAGANRKQTLLRWKEDFLKRENKCKWSFKCKDIHNPIHHLGKEHPWQWNHCLKKSQNPTRV